MSSNHIFQLSHLQQMLSDQNPGDSDDTNDTDYDSNIKKLLGDILFESFESLLKYFARQCFEDWLKEEKVLFIALKCLDAMSSINSDLGVLCGQILKFAEDNPEEFLRVLDIMVEEGNVQENILKKCIEMMIERVLRHEKLFEKASNQRSDFNPSTTAFEIVEEWIRISTSSISTTVVSIIPSIPSIPFIPAIPAILDSNESDGSDYESDYGSD